LNRRLSVATRAKEESKAVVVTGTPSNLPAYLQDYKGGSGLVGLGMEDFIVPRVKLLQSTSDEPKTFDNATMGEFWLNVLDEPLGDELEFIVCSNRKRYMLLPPMGDARGVLARADDAIHWNPPNGEWQVKLKNIKNPVTWKTAPTVRESGLAEFGSSNPDDPDSNPAATLFYEFLVHLPARPDVSPVLMSLARSQAKRARDLQGKIEFRRNVPMQAQRFIAKITTETGAEGDYFNYQFVSAGFADEPTYNLCRGITERFKEYKGADEDGLVGEASPHQGGAPKPGDDKKEY
jgi:hypothetical protein